VTSRRLRWLILGAGWSLALVYAFPGLMSPDSGFQLMQARGADLIGDWHPPIMALIWRTLDRIIAGPFGMLLLQTGAFLFGLDALVRRVLRPVTAAAIAVAILLWPPVLTPMAVIWKDAQMAGLMLAGAALLPSPRRRVRIAGLGLLVLASAMRYNAAAATLPLIALLLDEHAVRWRRYAIAAGCWLAVTVAAFGLNAAITERHDHAWHNSIALFDIVGTIRFSDRYPDADIERDLAGVPLVVHAGIQVRCEEMYTTGGHYELTHGERRIFDLPFDQHLDEVAAGWAAVLAHDPAAYLRHRLAVFASVTGLDGTLDGPVPRLLAVENQVAPLHLTTQHSAVQSRWMAWLTKLSRTWVFRPHCYLFLTLLMLPLCRSRVGWAVLLSGLFYELGLLFVAPASDYRYSHWMIAAAVIGIVLTFRSRQSPPAVPRSE
jgi:hypothetical protein